MSSLTQIQLKSATITVAGINLKAYMDESGTKYLYQKSVTDAIEKRPSSISEMLVGQSLQAIACNGSDISEILALIDGDSRPQRLNLVPPLIATAYWHYWSSRNNQLAVALTFALQLETLQRRLDDAFGVIKTPAEYEQETQVNYNNLRCTWDNIEDFRPIWKPLRQRLTDSHEAFQLFCEKMHWPAPKVSERLTYDLAGYTPKKLKELCILVDGNRTVGLNYTNVIYEVKLITECKIAFPRIKVRQEYLNSWMSHLQFAKDRAHEKCPEPVGYSR
jgi:hypothetical protein